MKSFFFLSSLVLFFRARALPRISMEIQGIRDRERERSVYLMISECAKPTRKLFLSSANIFAAGVVLNDSAVSREERDILGMLIRESWVYLASIMNRYGIAAYL